jgi:hypothetical protein
MPCRLFNTSYKALLSPQIETELDVTMFMTIRAPTTISFISDIKTL